MWGIELAFVSRYMRGGQFQKVVPVVVQTGLVLVSTMSSYSLITVNLCRYLAFTTADVENGWYGGTLIYDQDENSGAYKHYSEFCQVRGLHGSQIIVKDYNLISCFQTHNLTCLWT